LSSGDDGAGSFVQAPPELGNQFRDDPLLRSWLRRQLSETQLRSLRDEFDELGDIVT